jgi:hypothetical protein
MIKLVVPLGILFALVWGGFRNDLAISGTRLKPPMETTRLVILHLGYFGGYADNQHYSGSMKTKAQGGSLTMSIEP